jgi:hypothetical protein
MPMNYIRNATGEFVCPECGVTKARQNTMYYHMKSHATELPHKCAECPMQFLQKKSLELHVQAKHTPAPTLKAGPPKTLGEALKRRAALPTFACPFPDCKFTALSKGNCRIHIFRVHYGTESNIYLEDNACALCDTTFNSTTHYYYHIGPCMMSHTDHTFANNIIEKFI